MSAQHTPGPWVHHPEDNIITTPNGFCKLLEWQARSMHVPQAERDANARLVAAAPELLEALKAYRAARAMPSTGDYAAIPWEYKGGPRNPGWGGGDCEKHGRWYGSRCSSCYTDLEKLRGQADRDAVHARDNALRAADEKARAVIASIEGQHLDCHN